MSQITRIEMWRDVGFQEGAVEVPSVNDHLALLPHSDDELGYLRIEYEDGIKTSTEDFFSAFTIPLAFSDDILSYSYLRVTYSYNNVTSPQTFYGWIDDVALKSDTDGNPSIRVTWHIDMWRSYFSRAHFGYGLINRRPRSVFQPPQPVNAVIPKAVRSVPVVEPSLLWAVLNVIGEGESATVTRLTTMVYPVDPISPDRHVRFRLTADDTTPRTAPSLNQTVSGAYDEFMSLDPDSIISAFISPVCPWGVPHDYTNDTVTLFGGPAVHRYAEGHFSSDTLPYVTSVSGGNERYPTVKAVLSDDQEVKDDWFKLITNTSAYGAVRHQISDWKMQSFLFDVPYDSTYLIAVMEESSYGREISRSTDSEPIMAVPWSTLVKKTGVVFNDVVSFTGDAVLGRCDTIEWAVRDDSNGEMGKEAIHRLVVRNWNTTTTEISKDYNGYLVFKGRPESVRWAGYTTGVSTEDVESKPVPRHKGEERGYLSSRTGRYPEYTIPVSPVTSDDTSVVYLTGFDGAPVFTVPWGRTVDHADVSLNVTSSSVYLRLRFNGRTGASEGTEAIVPVPTIPVTTNSWSSYVYSGTRDADIAQRKAEAESALISGIASSVTGGVSNAVFASIGGINRAQLKDAAEVYADRAGRWEEKEGGNYREAYRREYGGFMTATKEIKPAVGPGVAAGASVGIGAATSLIEYGLTTRMNGILQGITDQATARQADAIAQDTTGMDWYNNCDWLRFVTVVPDPYSLERWSSDQELNGCTVSEAVPDCTSLISDGGPLRISELIVTGPIPPRARAYLRGRFANGVRIKTINHPVDSEDGE